METFATLTEIADRSEASVGVTDLAPFPEEAARIESRVAGGLHGGLSFTFAHPDTASQPAESFPWAVSIVVVAVPYLIDGDGVTDRRTVARFADGDRYKFLDAVLGEMADALSLGGRRTEIVYDDNRLIDRAVAIRAGVAWSGKSTMALTPRFGPWILIGSVVTDAKLTPTEPMRRTCGTCDACIPACPTNAIVAPGVLDARRCISAVLQRRGVIDPALRNAIGGRIYGCDDCLTACPPGDKALSRFQPTNEDLRAETVLTLSDEELEHLVEHWYVPSRRMRFVRRNALVALGNSGDTSSLGLLARYVCDPDPLLRMHAGWAIGRIGGVEAESLCVAALERESDAEVQGELLAAITASSQGGVYADERPAQRSVELKEIAT